MRGQRNQSARKQKKRRPSQAEKDFIKGRTNRVSVDLSSKALGFSPTQETASGSGTHGGSPSQKNRRSRKQTKQNLRRGDWD
jgi:hypothetical protein